LAPDEVAGFLASTFPEIAEDLASQIATPAVHALIAELMAQSAGRPRTLNDLLTSIHLGLSKLKLADIMTAVGKPAVSPVKLSAPPRRNGLKNGVH